MDKSVSRREFLKWSAVSAVGMALAACARPTPQVIEKEVPVEKVVKETVVVEKEVPVEKVVKETVVVEKEVAVEKVVTATPVPLKYKESPMLTELVKAGKLPPVEERLPVNPYVFPVMEMVGKLGGTMRRAFKGTSDRWGPSKLQDRGLVWYDAKLNMQPRAAESYEVNADGSVWTFHLRKGMKWSDGTPVTSADAKWEYENQILNSELTPSPPTWCSTGTPKVLAQFEFPDDYTVRYKFAHPNPLFIFRLGRSWHFTPGHHMKKYHIALCDDKAALEKEIKDKGFNTWVDYFGHMNYWFNNAERPSVGPWLAKNELSSEMFIMERNPYFFGIDSEGKQLPYVDRVTHRLFTTDDTKNMWVVNGEIDFQARHMTFSDFTLYKEGEKKGNYQVFLGVHAEHIAMQPNHTCKDPKIREFFQNRDVRIALSLAVDRDVLNDIGYDGMATPRQYSPISKSPQYYPKLSNVYIEYDPKKANELLDKAGYDKRGPDGIRLWKDGSGPISFIIEGTAQTGTPAEDLAQMVCKYLADVGIKASYKYAERSLYEEHYRANEIEAAWWGGDRTVVPLAPGAPIFLGTMIDRPWCPAWGLWRSSGGTDPVAEEPPPGHWIRKIWDIWDNEVAVQPDAKKQTEAFWKILDIWAEELPMIGFLGEVPIPIIVKNGFRNYLPGYPLDDTTGDEHLLNTETYFWEEPEKHV